MPPPDAGSKTKRWTLPVACFVVGCGVGFAAGVFSVQSARQFLVGLFASERPAAVTQPIAVERPAFRFEFPGNWSVDTKDSDYDPDHMFSVDSPGQSFVMFVIADGEVEPKTAVDEHASAQMARMMKDGRRTPLTTWGGRSCEGALISGKHLGLAPGTIRVFSFRERQKTFTISVFPLQARRTAPPAADRLSRSLCSADSIMNTGRRLDVFG